MTDVDRLRDEVYQAALSCELAPRQYHEAVDALIAAVRAEALAEPTEDEVNHMIDSAGRGAGSWWYLRDAIAAYRRMRGADAT